MALLLLRSMELGELKVFVTVATEHSFSRAAIKLCRTQPAVSQLSAALKRIWASCCSIAARSPRSSRRQAMRCCPKRSDCSEWPTKVATVRQLSQRDRAVLRIGGDEPDAHILLPALSTFLLQQPHVSVEFRRVADLDVLAEVGAGTIDIGITTRDACRRRCAPCRCPSCLPAFASCCRRATPCVVARAAGDGLHSERLVTLAGLPLPESTTMRATDDAAPPTGCLSSCRASTV